jgi:hypothetical protein
MDETIFFLVEACRRAGRVTQLTPDQYVAVTKLLWCPAARCWQKRCISFQPERF